MKNLFYKKIPYNQSGMQAVKKSFLFCHLYCNPSSALLWTIRVDSMDKNAVFEKKSRFRSKIHVKLGQWQKKALLVQKKLILTSNTRSENVKNIDTIFIKIFTPCTTLEFIKFHH